MLSRYAELKSENDKWLVKPTLSKSHKEATMKIYSLLIALIFLGSASLAFADGRDANREKVRQLDILTDTCKSRSGVEFEDCVGRFAAHSALVMCMTLYKKNDGARLDCFDENALNAGIKLLQLSQE